jgi:hypothetical protein
MFLVVRCQHASGACQSHSCPVLSLHEALWNYAELSHSTPPFLALRFHEKDLPPTPRLLQVRPILPPLRHILSKWMDMDKQTNIYSIFSDKLSLPEGQIQINATTSYKPLVDPFRLARLYNHIQSGLTLPPACLLSCMLACISIIMIFTTIILTQCMQYRLSRQQVTTKSLPEHQTGKHTETNNY